MNTPISCVASDLDFCLTHFGTESLDGFIELFVFTGVDRRDIMKIEMETERQRFTFERFFKTFTEQTGIALDHAALLPQCKNWLRDSLRFYPDSLSWFTSFPSPEVPRVIVTYGDQEYQGAKIEMVGLHAVPSHFISFSGEKHVVVRQLLEQYGPGILFVDDNPLEHDNVRREGMTEHQVRCVRVRREDSPYKNHKSEFSHEEVRALSEVVV